MKTTGRLLILLTPLTLLPLGLSGTAPDPDPDPTPDPARDPAPDPTPDPARDTARDTARDPDPAATTKTRDPAAPGVRAVAVEVEVEVAVAGTGKGTGTGAGTEATGAVDPPAAV